jgi:MFS family permease
MTRIKSRSEPAAEDDLNRIRGRALGILAVLCAAMFLDALDVSMMAVALPSIQHSWHMSTAALQWVVSGYVLGYGGFLLLGGRAADVLGRRRVFLVALAGFAVMSAMGGFAAGGVVLIASRFINGVTAGFTAPAGLSIILASFAEGPLRHRALAIYAATGAAGFTFGLMCGGLLSEVTWRLVFFMPSVVAVITLVAAVRLIPRDPAPAKARQALDVPGAVGVTAAALLLVFTLTQAPTVGWATPRTLGSLAGVAVLLVGFVAIEQRQASPLIRLGMLGHWPRVRANLGATAFVGGWAATQFIATLYMQDLRHWSALETAAAFWPCWILGLFVAPKLTSLIGRFGLLRVLSAGLTRADADRHRVRPVPANRPDIGLLAGVVPDLRPDRYRLRLVLLDSQHRCYRRRAARGARRRQWPVPNFSPVRHRAVTRDHYGRNPSDRASGNGSGSSSRLPRGAARAAHRIGRSPRAHPGGRNRAARSIRRSPACLSRRRPRVAQ